RGCRAAPGQRDPDPQLGRHDPAVDGGAGERAPAGGAGVLGLPDHGRPGRADAAAHAGLAVGLVARLDVRPVRARALAVAGLAAAQPGRLHCPARGLVRGRDRPPALRHLRPAAHQRGGQPQHHRRGGHVLAHHLRQHLRGDLRRGHLVPVEDDPPRPAAARALARARRRRQDPGAAAVGGRRRAARRAPRRGQAGGRDMNLELVLPVVWFGVIGFGVLMYVLLDGFVLGLGILAPLAEDEDQLDHMMNTAAPIWDGNETWLVLGGAGLLAAFPEAYALVLSALYLPVLAMLVALIFRGVAFEFRFKATRGKRFWGGAFSA